MSYLRALVSVVVILVIVVGFPTLALYFGTRPTGTLPPGPEL